MKESLNISERRTGFSLMEVLAAMMIGTMILIAVFNVYDRAESAAASVTRNLNNSRRPYEVLQLIAEDLDKMVTTNSDMNIIVVSRYIKNYAAALLVIRVKYKDPTNKERSYKEIFWQCNINPEGDANDLVLYRSYEGILPEDKLLDKDREQSEENVYVPICGGVTYFDIKIYTEKDKPEAAWVGGMPLGVTLTISFAEPFKNDDGIYDVPENMKYSRTIALDKSRKIKFDISEESFEDEANGINSNILDDRNSSSTKTKLPGK
ncbi:MAG: hypothetical protein JXA96_02265 [Sedimentisphaerales bacterium]|nr:hypothetical protein [Sedimentisphaerales bacterium]